MSVNHCGRCDKSFNSADVRMRLNLRGICLVCAEEIGFKGMTVEETSRCVAMIRIVKAHKKMTASQRQHLKDMES